MLKKSMLSDVERSLIGNPDDTPKRTIRMNKVKKIALVAHDNRKQAMLEWAEFNKGSLSNHILFGTGTTGKIIAEQLDLPVHRFKSGPLGGDQQVGAKICEGEIDFLIFFWDPLEAQPHDPDVKALLRLATLYNIPVAIDRASADFMISSPLMNVAYERILPAATGRYEVK
jgi:methylglyoxal synthase